MQLMLGVKKNNLTHTHVQHMTLWTEANRTFICHGMNADVARSDWIYSLCT